jgi:hypothetical protein
MTPDRINRLAVALLLILVANTVALAHHSFAMYDLRETVVFRGTVTRFRWVNPHVVLSVAGEAEAGQDPAIWNIELSSPGNLTRTGLSRRSLNTDDSVAVSLNPLRTGEPGGACLSVKLLATGQVLDCAAGAAIRTGERPNLP